ncbi:vomeronasal type-2 receptor 26-like [Anomaloglossus baeobatrachus]
MPLKGHQECCYDCAPCPEREIANKTDMDRCLKCPEDQWSNELRDTCIPRTLEFLSYNDPLGLCLVVIALLFCLLTTFILSMFIKYKHTAIVRANNRNLSFILLLSLILSFLCPLLFVGKPTKMSCLFRQVAFGNIFTIAVSSILAKTVTVVLAFRATKPDRSLRRFIGRHLATSLLLLSCFGEFLICVFWLSLAPPFPVYNTEMEAGKIILQCNEGSVVAFYMAFGYIGFLAVLSFLVAFMARKLPDTFNEAQYITFSMLVFCSVWISFIPAYLSTKGKYMVAVEVFAITASSAGLLGCIFIPKCYIMLLRPELNTKANLVVIPSFSLDKEQLATKWEEACDKCSFSFVVTLIEAYKKHLEVLEEKIKTSQDKIKLHLTAEALAALQTLEDLLAKQLESHPSRFPDFLKKKSTFFPSLSLCPSVEVFVRMVVQEIFCIPQFRPYDNLKMDEKKALVELKKMREIVIKPAVKGGGRENIVVWPVVLYEKEAFRKRHDPLCYQCLSKDPTNSFQMELDIILDQTLENGIIPRKIWVGLKFKYPCLPALYFLPKVHKDITNIPG